MHRIFFAIVLTVGLLLSLGQAEAAEVQLPFSVKPGELFLIRITPVSGRDEKIVLESEPGKVQFMGAVQGTPDIQMRSDTLVEIESRSGIEQCYELKYLAMGQDGSESFFKITDADGSRQAKISFNKEVAARSYSWLILAGGLILLVVGLKLWRYQKSSPNMMSTKSLFMNYEELEKARKMYFDNDAPVSSTAEPEKNQPAKPEPAPAPESSGAVAAATPKEANNSDSGSTKKMPADARTSQRSAVSSRLSSFSDDAPSASNEVRVELTDETGSSRQGQGEIVKVGRRRDNQLVLTGSEVSREHVMFFRKNGQVWIKPLTTSNVTKLDGHDLKAEMQVNQGAELNLGGTVFKVRISS